MKNLFSAESRWIQGKYEAIRFWVRITATAMTVSACLVAVPARGQAGQSKGTPKSEAPPYWAFAVNLEDGGTRPPEETADRVARHVPGSAAAFTYAQVQDLYNAPDWHPDGHPTMPEVVARGRKPEVYACGYCHLPNGQGRPENASLAGLPAAYIIEQFADFKSGARKSSEPRLKPVSNMIVVARNANEREIQAAAQYFSRLKPKPWTRVVETRMVPKTHVAGWMLVRSEGGAREPIGQRIIEMPEDLERTELRDDASGFVAYVPVGSVRQGEILVTKGERKMRCTLCHGADLRGHEIAPSIVGRSPSYMVRQLFDMQTGARSGVVGSLMRPVVAEMTVEDMVAIAAYLASMEP